MKYKTVRIKWSTQGRVFFNDTFIGRFFRKRRTRIPDLDDHISFADFDLKAAGLPQITVKPDKQLVIVSIHSDKLPLLKKILAYHGFDIVEIVDL